MHSIAGSLWRNQSGQRHGKGGGSRQPLAPRGNGHGDHPPQPQYLHPFRAPGANIHEKKQNIQNSVAMLKGMDPLQVGSFAEFCKAKAFQGESNTLANTYSPGDVVSTAHVAPNLNPRALSTDKSIALSVTVGPISCKWRHWLIIGILEGQGLYALPMFSAGARGPESVPEAKRHDILRVVGQNEEVFDILGTRRGEVLRTRSDGEWWPSRGTYVHAADFSLLSLQLHIAREGKIDAESVERVKKWAEVYWKKSHLSTDEQTQFIRQHNDSMVTQIINRPPVSVAHSAQKDQNGNKKTSKIQWADSWNMR